MVVEAVHLGLHLVPGSEEPFGSYKQRPVAISVAQGPAAALAVVDDLVATGSLSGSHLLPSVRGELLNRLGKLDDARREIEFAVRLCGNERERSLLQRKLAALA